jgi:hypothetical protein
MDERWSEKERQRDLDDLNNEAAGRDVGRISRFHHERDPKLIEEKKREKESRETALHQLMRDPAYAAAYQRANDAIDRAQQALDTALLENAQIAEDLQDRLDEMENRAARLPDGRAVFRAADGSLKTADGDRLRSEAVPASLIIPLDAPSYEDYAAGRTALTSAVARGAELSEIQTTILDPARDRLNDEDPPSAEELVGINESMGRITSELESGRIPTLEDTDQQSPANGAPELAVPIGPIDLPALD